MLFVSRMDFAGGLALYECGLHCAEVPLRSRLKAFSLMSGGSAMALKMNHNVLIRTKV